MRHFRLPDKVAALARSMVVTTTQACLIALSGSFKGKGSSRPRTVTRAVALTTVAVAAD